MKSKIKKFVRVNKIDVKKLSKQTGMHYNTIYRIMSEQPDNFSILKLVNILIKKHKATFEDLFEL